MKVFFLLSFSVLSHHRAYGLRTRRFAKTWLVAPPLLVLSPTRGLQMKIIIHTIEFVTSQDQRRQRNIKLHGHCQQKALSSVAPTVKILSLPENYTVQTIPSGCCGMAGSFGYEKEHYDISMKIGELVLFPAVRNKTSDTIIAAPGTSCRHQIKDGTKVIAKHPVEILYEALG